MISYTYQSTAHGLYLSKSFRLEIIKRCLAIQWMICPILTAFVFYGLHASIAKSILVGFVAPSLLVLFQFGNLSIERISNLRSMSRLWVAATLSWLLVLSLVQRSAKVVALTWSSKESGSVSLDGKLVIIEAMVSCAMYSMLVSDAGWFWSWPISVVLKLGKVMGRLERAFGRGEDQWGYTIQNEEWIQGMISTSSLLSRFIPMGSISMRLLYSRILVPCIYNTKKFIKSIGMISLITIALYSILAVYMSRSYPSLGGYDPQAEIQEMLRELDLNASPSIGTRSLLLPVSIMSWKDAWNSLYIFLVTSVISTLVFELSRHIVLFVFSSRIHLILDMEPSMSFDMICEYAAAARAMSISSNPQSQPSGSGALKLHSDPDHALLSRLIFHDMLLADAAYGLSRYPWMRSQLFLDDSGVALKRFLSLALGPLVRLLVRASDRGILDISGDRDWILRLVHIAQSQLIQAPSSMESSGAMLGTGGNNAVKSGLISRMHANEYLFAEADNIKHAAESLTAILECSVSEDVFGLLVQRWIHVILAVLLSVQLVGSRVVRSQLANAASLRNQGIKQPIFHHQVGAPPAFNDSHTFDRVDAEWACSACDTVSLCSQRMVDVFEGHFTRFLRGDQPLWPSQLNPQLRALLRL